MAIDTKKQKWFADFLKNLGADVGYQYPGDYIVSKIAVMDPETKQISYPFAENNPFAKEKSEEEREEAIDLLYASANAKKLFAIDSQGKYYRAEIEQEDTLKKAAPTVGAELKGNPVSRFFKRLFNKINPKRFAEDVAAERQYYEEVSLVESQNSFVNDPKNDASPEELEKELNYRNREIHNAEEAERKKQLARSKLNAKYTEINKYPKVKDQKEFLQVGIFDPSVKKYMANQSLLEGVSIYTAINILSDDNLDSKVFLEGPLNYDDRIQNWADIAQLFYITHFEDFLHPGQNNAMDATGFSKTDNFDYYHPEKAAAAIKKIVNTMDNEQELSVKHIYASLYGSMI